MVELIIVAAAVAAVLYYFAPAAWVRDPVDQAIAWIKSKISG